MVEGETFKIVTHSQGGAYGAGMAQYLIEKGYKVETMVHLSTHQTQGFTTPSQPNTLQLSYEYDPVAIGSSSLISGANRLGVVNRGDLGLQFKHGSTRVGSTVWGEVQDLQNAFSTFSPGFSTMGQPGVDNTGVVIPPSSGVGGTTNNTNFSTFQNIEQ
ncbi:MAG: hypothetical protein LAT68_17205 [Cyclobacteriaceae bacterium]|nr:hypothetical protein [Cyclobacteriaceae bacterium]MCH8518037.1 hypothetical protein [Cyclobacteriaceae bacterium]